METQMGAARRRRLLRLLRRAGLVGSLAAIAAAVYLFWGIQVSGDSAHELIAGSADTHSLLWPLALFLAGVCGLAICLG